VARAIDIGTCNLVSAIQDDNRQIQIKTIRDAFLDMENDSQVKSMLKMSKVDMIEAGEKIYVLGDSALVMANIFKRNVRRPLKSGVISPGELEAEKILMILIENILGRAAVQGEICYYSVPAVPVDKEMDIIYHQAMFSKMIGSLGYKPVAMTEAAAIVYSNAAKEQFSAIAMSFGAGQVNVVLMYQAIIGVAFSILNSGDWIDESAARATGSQITRIQAIKEKGIDLLNPEDGDPKTLREREAITIYYKSLALRVLDVLKNEFIKKQATIELPHAIPIILSGGTSKAKNFKEFFEQAFNTVRANMPIPISEIRYATDQLNAVAQGLLVAALNYEG
jgi:Ethanolamine utilization protein EutJ (predicted chaperonin)